jgi:type I restriction enzyme, S subunit
VKGLPEGWEWSTFAAVADVALGRQRSPQHHTGPNMRPYLRSANVTWAGIDLSDVKEMNFHSGDAEAFALKPGDLLLNEASGSPNEVGKPAIWRGEIEGCCFQTQIRR